MGDILKQQASTLQKYQDEIRKRLGNILDYRQIRKKGQLIAMCNPGLELGPEK